MLCAVCCMLRAVCCVQTMTLLSGATLVSYAVCFALYAVSCMLLAVCRLLYAVCCMPFAVCCVLYAVCCMPCAVCFALYAVCCTPCAVCCALYAVCCIRVMYALRCMLCAVRRVMYAVCCMLCAVCCVKTMTLLSGCSCQLALRRLYQKTSPNTSPSQLLVSHIVAHQVSQTTKVCWLVASRASDMLVYLRDGCAQTVVRAATQR